MMRLNVVVVFTVVLICFSPSVSLVTANDDDRVRESARSLYNALDDGGYSPTWALILKDYMLINSSQPLGAWSNPAYAIYDQQFVAALQSQLDDSNLDGLEHHQQQLHADQASPLLPVYGGPKFLTNYCGPGNWSLDGSTVQTPYFSSIDQCCKHHDECPDTIVARGDYRRYADLPHKPQLFTRLRCNCDVEFLQCLKNIATFFSYAVAWIYTKFQSSCFDYEYPVMECASKKNDGIFSSDRCLSYLVDNSFEKRWQWFDVPYLSSDQAYFPKVHHRYELDCFDRKFNLNQ